MRVRKKKHGEERLNACSEYIIKDRSDIDKIPVVLEIGCGKGGFICGMAKKYPEINFVALEKVSDVIMLACERAKNEELKNVKFMNCDAKNIGEYFDKGQISRIYLNFSDPWPKAGHYKRRLTYKDFLDVYKSVLTDDGAIFMKTDNIGLFEFSLEQFRENGFRLENVTNDLWESEFAAENIPTEYELRFHEMGVKINRLEAYIK